ncbi:glycosyltransferase family 2 protein [Paenibacillus sp. CMAA1364]
MSLTSIIIPTYNGLHLLAPCIDAIRQYTAVPYEIIVVDNGSTDETLAYCLKESLIFISLPENLGFPIACNTGMSVASGDQVVLLNNDVIVSHHWLDHMLIALYSEDEIGIVGPMTRYVSGIQRVDYVYENSEQFHALARKWNISDPLIWHKTERIVGLCFLLRRELMNVVGLLDEQFSPGHYEDDDYCFRARAHGYKLIACGDVLVHHVGSASFKLLYPDGWQELIQRNHQLFIDKWHVNPHQFIVQS